MTNPLFLWHLPSFFFFPSSEMILELGVGIILKTYPLGMGPIIIQFYWLWFSCVAKSFLDEG